MKPIDMMIIERRESKFGEFEHCRAFRDCLSIDYNTANNFKGLNIKYIVLIDISEDKFKLINPHLYEVLKLGMISNGFFTVNKITY